MKIIKCTKRISCVILIAGMIITSIFSGNMIAYAEPEPEIAATEPVENIKDIETLATTVKYTKDDFIGYWDGEYDGYRNVNGQKKWYPRHFFIHIKTCESKDGKNGEISGYLAVTDSSRATTKDDRYGVYGFTGTVDFSTGMIQFCATDTLRWFKIDDVFDGFTGKISVDKDCLTGSSTSNDGYMFEAKRIVKKGDPLPLAGMIYKGKWYDLCKDTVTIDPASTEKATIIVDSGYEGKSYSDLCIFQGQDGYTGRCWCSNTGMHVNILPGSRFDITKPVKLELHNLNGTIVKTVVLNIKFGSEDTDRSSQTVETKRLTVYQNKITGNHIKDHYIVCKDAVIKSGDKTVHTDLNGNASIQMIKGGDITVSKDGFISRTISAEQLEHISKIYLQPVTDATPVISAVWVRDTDVLNETYPINRISNEYITLAAEVDWGRSSAGKIELVQENRTFSFNGNSAYLCLSDRFDTAQPIYIRAVDSRGRSTRKKLMFENATSSKAANTLDGASLDVGQGISLTLPDTIKPEFFAGVEVGAGLDALVPVSISASDGKITAVFGLDMGKMTYDSKEKNPELTIKKIRDQIKDIKASKKGIEKKLDDFRNLELQNKEYFKKENGKLGFDADFTIMGYAEGTYDAEGKIVLQDSGILMHPSLSLQKSWPFMAGPVPMYVEAELSGEMLMQLQAVFNEQAKNFTASGTTTGNISLSGGLGVGLRDVMYASGGVTGTLTPTMKMYADTSSYFKMTASVNGYARVGLVCFVAEKKFDMIKDKVLCEKGYSVQQANILEDPTYPFLQDNPSSTSNGSDTDFTDASAYQLKDLSYLEGKSEFLANDKSDVSVMSDDASGGNLVTQVFKTNIYQESTPQLVSFGDGKRLAVWQDADTDAVDDLCLYYSYYNGSAWSQPAKVYEDHTMDCQPYLTVIDDTPYVVWQNATRTFADLKELTLDTVKPYFDISVGKFQTETGTFAVSTIQNTGLDMSPRLTGADGALYAVWVNAEDWFGEGTSSILSSSFDGTSWSSPEQELTGRNAITSVAADYYDGALHWAAAVDTDGDIQTTDDIRVMEDGAYVADSDTAQTSPSYLDHDLYWYSNKNVVDREMDATEGCISPGQYQFLTVDGNKVLVYTESDGFATFVKASYFDTALHRWGEGKVLKEADEFVGALSVTADADQDYMLLLNAMEVKEGAEQTSGNPYGESMLKLLTVSPYCDLALEDLSYQEDTFCAGSNMNFTLTVRNNGTKAVNGADILIRDAAGNTLSKTAYDRTIVPGDVVQIPASYPVAEGTTSQTVTVSIMPKNGTDIRLSDNAKSAQLKYEDVAVENIGWGTRNDGKTAITADIVNRGYTKQTDLSVSLRKGSADGTVVETKKIASLDGMDLENLTFVVSAQKNDVYYVVINDREDDCTANNQDFIVILDDDAVEPGVENGLWHDGEQFVYYKDGEADASYTGFVEYQNEWYYVKKGTVADTGFNQSGEDVVYATINGKTGWYYTNLGKADFSHNGFVQIGLGWYYVKNGVGQDTGFNQSGKDIVYGTINGKADWYYTNQGRVDFSYTGFAQNGLGWWYVESGKVTFKKNSVIHGVVNKEDGWWYVVESKVTFKDTVAQNESGWWCIRNGKVDFNYTGFAQNENGWWYVEDGKVTLKKSSVIHGVVNKEDGWWYVVESKVTFKDTVAQNENGWWRIKNGKVDFSYTGIAQNENGWWRIENGKVNLNFTGVAQNEYGWWYVKNGKVDMNYSGKVTYNGKTYTIKNGKVVSGASDEEPDEDVIISPGGGEDSTGQDEEPAGTFS